MFFLFSSSARALLNEVAKLLLSLPIFSSFCTFSFLRMISSCCQNFHRPPSLLPCVPGYSFLSFSRQGWAVLERTVEHRLVLNPGQSFHVLDCRQSPRAVLHSACLTIVSSSVLLKPNGLLLCLNQVLFL